MLAVSSSLGLLTRPIESPAWEQVQAGQPELNSTGSGRRTWAGARLWDVGRFSGDYGGFFVIRTNAIWVDKDRAAGRHDWVSHDAGPSS